eukprot:4779609-Amphidinium_carterae.2
MQTGIPQYSELHGPWGRQHILRETFGVRKCGGGSREGREAWRCAVLQAVSGVIRAPSTLTPSWIAFGDIRSECTETEDRTTNV